MENPVIVGITHGDINGIGYEVILRALAGEGVTELFTPVVFGLPVLMEKAAALIGEPNLKFNVISDASEAEDGKINVVALKDNPDLTPGKVNGDAGKSALESLETAVEALKEGYIDVLVTAPISKEGIQSESFKFPGHTEYLSMRLGEGEDGLMMLCNDSLRVALLTKHIPVSQIASNITIDKVVETVEKFSESLTRDFGIVRPSIAVLSLNPHAGDGGLLGKEEEEILKPALQQLLQKGILAFGPFATDGFFGHASYKKFDGVLAMYHDQGLAPFKTIASGGGVNFTAGLPFIRTSPDHGTAFDIAWKGEASGESMREAVYMAVDIFRRRNIYEGAKANPLKKFLNDRPEKNNKTEKSEKLESTEVSESTDSSDNM